MEGFVRKSDRVRFLVKEKEYKKALAIAKGFRRGIKVDEQKQICRAYECIINPEFYRQIGRKPAEEIAAGIDILIRIYGERSKE